MTTQSDTSFSVHLARTVSDILAPAVSVFLICLVAGVAHGNGIGVGALWGLLAGLFCAVIPMTVIGLAVRRERLSDRHVTRRDQRWWVFLMCLGSVLIGLTVIIIFQGPKLLLWVMGTMIVGLIVAGLLTVLGLKVSMHSFCLTSLIVLIGSLHSPWWYTSALALLPLLYFARLRLKHHTVLELIVGTFLAVLIMLASVQLLHLTELLHS